MNVGAGESIGGAQKGLKPKYVQDLDGRVEDESGIRGMSLFQKKIVHTAKIIWML
jgi:DNA-binding transcriptional regulator of glucitol operon